MSGGVKTGGLDVQLLWPCKDGFVVGDVPVRRVDRAVHAPADGRGSTRRAAATRRTRDKDWLDYANQLIRRPRADRRSTSGSRASSASSAPPGPRPSCSRRRATGPADRAGRHARRRRRSPQFAARDVLRRGRRRRAARPSRSPRPDRGSRLVAHRARSASVGRRGSASTPHEVLARARSAGALGSRRAAVAGGPPLDGVKVARPDVGDGRARRRRRVMADFGAARRAHRDRAPRRRRPHDRRRSSRTSRATTPSGLLFNMTTGKRSISVDLRQPLGRRGARRPGALGRRRRSSRSRRAAGRALGLDYERLPTLRPGPDHDVELPVRPDRAAAPLRRVRHDGRLADRVLPPHRLAGPPPCGPFGAYTRLPSPRFALCALLAALDHRRRTGEGQYLDFAQAEACAALPVAGAARPRRQRPRGRPAAATPTRRWRRTACTRAPATTPGWPSPAATTPTGGRSPRCVDRADLAPLGAEAPRSARAELDDARRRLDRRTRTRRGGRRSPSPPACPPTPCRTPASASPTRSWRHLGHWVTLPHPEHGTIVVEGTPHRAVATRRPT